MSAIIDDKVVAGAQDPNVVKEDPLIALTEKVTNLYLFRDHYFENHPLEDAANKSKDVESEMKSTLMKFDECKGYEIDGARAKYYYLKGKALNVTDKFIPQAEELLSKAVKLEPKLIEAWNELGECYWKNNDIHQAKNCFVGALPHVRTILCTPKRDLYCSESRLVAVVHVNTIHVKPVSQDLDSDRPSPSKVLSSGTIDENSESLSLQSTLKPIRFLINCILFYVQGKNKVSLRNLSMVLRQEITLSQEERLKNAQDGVELAKEAVGLDPSDGTSWAILGNAYLSSYFIIAQNPSILRLCMSAYGQAEKDPAAKNNPDLHYNKAMALKYQEEYKLALESFYKAKLLDPTWETPSDKQMELLKYLDNVQTSIKTRGCIKPKKLMQMIQSLDDRHMGPYQGGSYVSGAKSVKLVLTPLNDLVTGINLEKMVFGKVVCWIQDSDSVPFAFCLIDREKICMAVTLYNLAKGKGVTVGDSVAIPEPFVIHHRFAYEKNNFDFKSIRVETPVVLVVNGKKLGRDQQASVKMSTFKKSD